MLHTVFCLLSECREEETTTPKKWLSGDQTRSYSCSKWECRNRGLLRSCVADSRPPWEDYVLLVKQTHTQWVRLVGKCTKVICLDTEFWREELRTLQGLAILSPVAVLQLHSGVFERTAVLALPFQDILRGIPQVPPQPVSSKLPCFDMAISEDTPSMPAISQNLLWSSWSQRRRVGDQGKAENLSKMGSG